MKPETVARILLFLLLAAAGFAGVQALAPRGGYDYELHARMPENGGWSHETLHAEVGLPLRLRMTSDDVLHSFAIGQMDLAPVDLPPGAWQETTLVFDKPGRYTFYCTRWCGRSHWRMRGTILVTGGEESTPQAQATPPEKPLYLRLGLDLDAPHPAEAVPAQSPSAERGANFAARIPSWALVRQTYQESSPARLWMRLRAEPDLQDLDDDALWDVLAFLYQRQTSPAALAEAERLYAINCAACHGETGRGDGVMVEGLPRFDPSAAHVGPANQEHAGQIVEGGATPAGAATRSGGTVPGEMAGEMRLAAPPDFTDPRGLLGASPALLEGKLLRGGMGTGMPYWGPIFTQAQLDALIAYLYTFALNQ